MTGRTLLPLQRIGALAALALLCACTEPPEDAMRTAPAATSPRPEAREEAKPDLPVSTEDLRLAAYYNRVQTTLKSQGLLRTDGGGPDTPRSAFRLTEDFVRVALYSEYRFLSTGLVPEETASRLHRWDVPVRIRLTVGDGVPARKRAQDHKSLSDLVPRLAAATGHPVSVTTGSNANFDVLILTETERRSSGALLRNLVPGLSSSTTREIENLARETYCVVFAFADGPSAPYNRAVAVIRAEHPDLLRTSCIHEEVTQGLGLANDSPTARPSIFNDDEEFALLTRHDEDMLRILYDPRLRIGMAEPEARPIVKRIAEGLFATGS
ncbi:DUF2927 domain-containing protein [Roseicyclus sp. F158]|uniref:DUF2927 domain-containing protein n=1 Tax=Tropicimonas omnivorans TaxID=3075590 RepID=A0ABU3DG25_9RHOB|nr:DUF2927 domain-containing protein [Roseicyclus sp. F158]MDT0682513.1 DUF2927 domain-containing protein [Roseicyclus sp. F158]